MLEDLEIQLQPSIEVELQPPTQFDTIVEPPPFDVVISQPYISIVLSPGCIIVTNIAQQGPIGPTGPQGPQGIPGTPGGKYNYRLINTEGSFNLSSQDDYVDVDCSSGDIAILLYDANIIQGGTIKINRLDDSDNLLTIACAVGGQTINAKPSYTYMEQNDSLELVPNGVAPSCNYRIT